MTFGTTFCLLRVPRMLRERTPNRACSVPPRTQCSKRRKLERSCALASSRQDATELNGVEAMLLGLTGAALDVGTTHGTVENEHEGAAVPAASIGNHIGDGLDRHSHP
jgi:hypothetical protein